MKIRLKKIMTIISILLAYYIASHLFLLFSSSSCHPALVSYNSSSFSCQPALLAFFLSSSYFFWYPSLHAVVSQFFLRLLASSSSPFNQLFFFCQPSFHAAVSQFFLRLLASSSLPVYQLVARVYIIVIRQYCTYLVRQFMCAGEIREILLFSILFCC